MPGRLASAEIRDPAVMAGIKPGPNSPDDGTFHKERSYPSEQAPIIDRELRDMVQARLAGNDAQRNADGRIAQPSLLAGMLSDGDGNRMTPSHAVKKETRYRYNVSRP
jgi:site-specific DNA recombinase